MLRFGSLPACILMFGLTACTNSSVPDTREADVRAVHDVEAAWVKDIGAKDVDKFVAYYADDATLLMPNAPALNGKQAIRAALKPMLADPKFSLTFQDTRAETSKGGDLVYTTGTYTMTFSAPKNPKSVTTDKGKYLTVFRKQPDGSWKAVADMINSDLPLVQSAKTTSKRIAPDNPTTASKSARPLNTATHAVRQWCAFVCPSFGLSTGKLIRT